MVLTTRALAAQNSPPATRTRSSGHTPTTSPMTTPRKAPHCRRCKLPMKGHPASSCPISDASKSETKVFQAAAGTEPLTDALSSMKLASPARTQPEGDDKDFIRKRRRQSIQEGALVASASLLSLSTNSNDIVARLLQPGVFDNTLEDSSGGESRSRVVQWQETLATTPKKTPKRSPMPGTLIPPTPESSFLSSRNSFSKEESPASNITIVPPTEYSGFPASSPTTQRGRPLGRSMSAVERDLFVSRLADEAAATIYVIPKADVEDIRSEAASLKFITHIVMSDEKTDTQALLILGRSERAVQALLRKVEDENRKASENKAQEGSVTATSALKAYAGGAVVGAVGAWAGLAFS